jgi:16S rRNA (guanine527-N7)-methyltransferase
MADILPSSGSVLDVGSGGGFPGIPLAIVRPDLQWRLLEPRQKRVSFLKATAARLGLKNVEVIAARSDETPTSTSDLAVTRATFSDVDGARTVLDWLNVGGALYALRSVGAETWPNAETQMIEFGREVRRIDRLS